MAGRVERRIHDKFYFVLDEVGASDSEPISDNEDKLSNEEKERNSRTENNDTQNSVSSDTSTGRETLSELSNKNIVNALDSFANVSQSSNTSCEDMLSRKKIKSLRSEIESIKMKHNNTAFPNVTSDETSAVIDMDIDSDSETCDRSVKPLLKITFRDENVRKQLKSSLNQFLSQQFKNCSIINNCENSLELEVYDKNSTKLIFNDVLDFNLDTTPGDNEEIPFYEKFHSHVLSDQTSEPSKNVNRAFVGSCYNCLGNHNLKHCPKPRDGRAINRNRLKLINTPKNSRYHLDDNQKFGHLQPGVLSKKLRNALSLHRHQQPQFFYRMRLLGYPPAWLEEAKVSHSGVVVYDKKGVPVLEEDEEEGEIVPEGAKDKFDVTKIIEFPGFNMPLPESFKEEGGLYNCPALSEEQSKGNLIKQLEPKTVQAYVKKSLNKPNEEEKVSLEENDKRIPSPTIEEMIEKKKRLLMELSNEDSGSDTKVNFEESSTEGPGVSDAESLKISQIKQLGSVKKLEFGTPLLKSVSPFSKLPSREQFSVNVSDVINFENLPNSTGKYETMRQVISKIRDMGSKMQQSG